MSWHRKAPPPRPGLVVRQPGPPARYGTPLISTAAGGDRRRLLGALPPCRRQQWQPGAENRGRGPWDPAGKKRLPKLEPWKAWHLSLGQPTVDNNSPEHRNSCPRSAELRKLRPSINCSAHRLQKHQILNTINWTDDKDQEAQRLCSRVYYRGLGGHCHLNLRCFFYFPGEADLLAQGAGPDVRLMVAAAPRSPSARRSCSKNLRQTD